MFKGTQTQCKEQDYLLIYDPKTGSLILEKQDSVFNLRNIRQAKRPAAIANLEDGGIAVKETLSAPPGVLRMPKGLQQQCPAKESVNKSSAAPQDDDDFSDLENMLIQDMASV